MYYPDGNDLIVAATNSGNDKLPLWYLNLKASPNAVVQVGSLKMGVSAHEASGEERTRLWNILKEEQPVFKVYEKSTERTIPVIVLRVAENP